MDRKAALLAMLIALVFGLIPSLFQCEEASEILWRLVFGLERLDKYNPDLVGKTMRLMFVVEVAKKSFTLKLNKCSMFEWISFL